MTRRAPVPLSELARRGECLLRAQRAARRLWPEGVPACITATLKLEDDAILDAFVADGARQREGGTRVMHVPAAVVERPDASSRASLAGGAE